MDLNTIDVKEVTFAVLFLATFIYMIKDSKTKADKESAREERYLQEAAQREVKYQEIINNLTTKIEQITREFSEKLELIAQELKQIKDCMKQ
jgi:gamma-glutamylcysteine synthetase